MNRLRRRFRRARTASRLSKRCSDGASRGSSPLAIEALEPRLLLTTVTLPADALGEAVFVYADPEGTEPGTEVSTFNEMRIGTLSGEPPAQDVVVEVLNYRGEDIPGYLTVDGVTTSPGGGPGGVNIIEEIPHQLDIFNQGGYWPRMNALATDSSGQTYGITTSGQVVSVDPDAGTYSTLGIVEDTDTIAAMGNVIDYNRWGCEYEAAAFDPVSGTLYAVVTGPIRFDATGDVTSISEVLVSINLDDSGGEPIGEADPVGQDPVTGLPDYRYSQVGTTFTNTFGDYTIPEGGVTTIVYSEEPGDNDTNTGDTPVFIAYEYGTVTVDDEGQTFGQFLRVAVAPAAVSGVFTVQAAPIAIADESTIIEGLMYGDTGDGQRMLFALNGGDTNELAWIDLDFNPDTDEELIHSIVPYGQNDQEEDIVLTGMSYDNVNDVGYATDPLHGDLYQISTNGLAIDEESGDLVVMGGLADIYMVYIASATADTYITFTGFTVDEDGNPIYTPTSGEGAYLFTYDDTDVYTPDTAGGS